MRRGLTLTSWIVSSEPGSSAAATISGAADEKSPGTSTSPSRSALGGSIVTEPGRRRTVTPAASSISSVWSRVGFGSTTVVRGAEELRVKESDRIAAVADALHALGARIKPRDDGWEVTGVPARLRGGRMDAVGDHRIAMLGAVAGLASREPVEIGGAEAVSVSFPGFFDLLESVARR